MDRLANLLPIELAGSSTDKLGQLVSWALDPGNETTAGVYARRAIAFPIIGGKIRDTLGHLLAEDPAVLDEVIGHMRDLLHAMESDQIEAP